MAYGPVGCKPHSEIIQGWSWYPWAAYLRASITSSSLWSLGWHLNRDKKERHWERRWTISGPQTMWIEPARTSYYHFWVSAQVTYVLLETVPLQQPGLDVWSISAHGGFSHDLHRPTAYPEHPKPRSVLRMTVDGKEEGRVMQPPDWAGRGQRGGVDFQGVKNKPPLKYPRPGHPVYPLSSRSFYLNHWLCCHHRQRKHSSRHFQKANSDKDLGLNLSLVFQPAPCFCFFFFSIFLMLPWKIIIIIITIIFLLSCF